MVNKEIMREKMKRIVVLRYIYHMPKDIVSTAKYKINLLKSSKQRSSKELLCFKNQYQNERCFIVGLGPSLSIHDLELIKDEYSFSSNRCYQLFPKTSWRPTFYCTGDPMFAKSIKGELIDIANEVRYCILNLAHIDSYAEKMKYKKNVYYYKTQYGSGYNVIKNDTMKKIKRIDLTKELDSVGTITYEMIQMAIYMGFKEIYLLGVDHSYGCKPNYSTYISANNQKEKKVMSTEICVDAWTKGYERIRKYSDAHDIKICNVTRGGMLEVFERRELEDII